MAISQFLDAVKVDCEDEGELKMHPRFVMPQGERTRSVRKCSECLADICRYRDMLCACKEQRAQPNKLEIQTRWVRRLAKHKHMFVKELIYLLLSSDYFTHCAVRNRGFV